MKSYKLGWCHQCACAVVSCTVPNCHATTCNSVAHEHDGVLSSTEDIYTIEKELGLSEISFKDYEHQDLDWLEDTPLIEIAERMAKSTEQGFYREDPTYTHACASITRIAIQLIRSGKTTWHFEDALGYASKEVSDFVHIFRDTK